MHNGRARAAADADDKALLLIYMGWLPEGPEHIGKALPDQQGFEQGR